MGMIDYAIDELRRAGLFDKDSDCDGAIAPNVLALLGVLSCQGHSGGSLERTLDIFNKLARRQPLTGLTYEPGQWIDQTEASGTTMFQHRRDPTVFSDGSEVWSLSRPGEKTKLYPSITRGDVAAALRDII